MKMNKYQSKEMKQTHCGFVNFVCGWRFWRHFETRKRKKKGKEKKSVVKKKVPSIKEKKQIWLETKKSLWLFSITFEWFLKFCFFFLSLCFLIKVFMSTTTSEQETNQPSRAEEKSYMDLVTQAFLDDFTQLRSVC